MDRGEGQTPPICLNCLSSDVDLFDFSENKLGFIHNTKFVPFPEVFKFCLQQDEHDPPDSPDPTDAKVCETCSRQYRNIFKMRKKLMEMPDSDVEDDNLGETYADHIDNDFDSDAASVKSEPEPVATIAKELNADKSDEAFQDITSEIIKTEEDSSASLITVPVNESPNTVIDIVDDSSDVEPKPKALHKHVCEICARRFRAPGRLQRHYLSIHEKPGSREVYEAFRKHLCPHCPKRFPAPGALKKHIASMHVDRTFLCPDCGKEFSSRAALQGHSFSHMQHNNKEKNLKCDICSKLFYNLETLRQHMDKRHIEKEDTMLCPQCPRRLFHRRSLFEDHQRLHLPITACECLRCGVALASYNDLLNHNFELHRATRHSQDVKCGACKKTFTTAIGLRHHLLITHMGQMQECKVCGKKFSQKPALKEHMWLHKTECPYPYWCNVETCTFRGRFKTIFINHLRTKHNIEYDPRIHKPDESELVEIMKKKDELYANDPSKKRERNDMKALRTYQCNQCDKRFKSRNTWYSHRNKKHKAPKLLECPHEGCNKTFPPTKSQLLWEHSFEHRGFMPFNCAQCSYKITSKTRFQQHLLKIHQITYDEKIHGYHETEPTAADQKC